MIVVEGNSVLIQEREQVVLMPSQAFDQSLGVTIFPRCLDQFGQAKVQTVSTGPVGLRRQRFVSSPQTNRIADQTTKFLHELRPMLAGRLVLFGVFQLAQQMYQTRLSHSACDRVVRSAKIGDQRPRELLDEELFQGRTAARSIM